MNYAFILVSDIHYRPDAPEGASSIMKALLADLEKQRKTLTDFQPYIIFAGDTVNAGQNIGAFESFAREMDVQLSDLGFPKDNRLIIPGNHDLDRSAVEDAFDECTRACEEHTKQESHFNDFVEKSNLLPGHFANYEVFAD